MADVETTRTTIELAPNQNRSRKGLLAAGAILVLGVGAGTWRMVRARTGDEASAAQSAPARTVFALDSFTVNLADPEEGRFLRTTFSLGVDGALPRPARGGGTAADGSAVSIAAIRDSILTVLAQCKSDDLLLPEGKLRLKENLLSALNRDVPALGAREVYFTEFLVQR